MGISCSTGPEFERVNKNDPSGGSFIPDSPSGQNYTITEEGNIALHWKDNTDYEDSYVIYKSVHSDTSFKEIAVLEKDSESFTDNSGVFGYPTIYKIVSRVEDRESVTPTLVQIDLDEFADISFDAGTDQVNASWTHNFDLGAKLNFMMKSVNNETETNLGSVDLKEDHFSFPRPHDDLEYDFYVTLIFENESGSSSGPEIIDTIELNVSFIKNHSFLTETTLNISLENPFDAGSGYNFYLIKGTSVQYLKTFEEGSSEFELDLVLAKGQKVVLGVSTLKGVLESKIKEYTFYATTPSVILEDIQSIDPTTVNLIIRDTSGISRSYHLYRSGSNCSEDNQIAVIPPETDSYIDNNLQESTGKYYCYSLKTNLSDLSNKIRIQFGNDLMLEDSILFDITSTNNLSSDINKFGSLIALNSDSEILLYDTNDHSSTTFQNNGLSQIARISPDETTLLIGNSNGNLAIYKLSDHSLVESIDFTGQGSILDIRFSPIENTFFVLTTEGAYSLDSSGGFSLIGGKYQSESGFIYVNYNEDFMLVAKGKELFNYGIKNDLISSVKKFSLDLNVSSMIHHIDYYHNTLLTGQPGTAIVSLLDGGIFTFNIEEEYGGFIVGSQNGPLVYRRAIYIPTNEFLFNSNSYSDLYHRIYNEHSDLIFHTDSYPIVTKLVGIGYLEETNYITTIRVSNKTKITLYKPLIRWKPEDIDF